MFAYCNNNPVNLYDPTGHSWESFWDSTFGKVLGTVLTVGAVVGLTILTAGVGTAVTGLFGTATPLLAGIVGSTVGGGISGAIFGAGFSVLTQGLENGFGKINIEDVGKDALAGAITGAIGGAFSKLQFSSAYLKTVKGGQFLLETINFSFQSVGHGFISFASSLFSGNSINDAALAFISGMIGGAIGCNFADSIVKSATRTALETAGISFVELVLGNI